MFSHYVVKFCYIIINPIFLKVFKFQFITKSMISTFKSMQKQLRRKLQQLSKYRIYNPTHCILVLVFDKGNDKKQKNKTKIQISSLKTENTNFTSNKIYNHKPNHNDKQETKYLTTRKQRKQQNILKLL